MKQYYLPKSHPKCPEHEEINCNSMDTITFGLAQNEKADLLTRKGAKLLILWKLRNNDHTQLREMPETKIGKTYVKTLNYYQMPQGNQLLLLSDF